jgi:hypothetical protein
MFLGVLGVCVILYPSFGAATIVAQGALSHNDPTLLESSDKGPLIGWMETANNNPWFGRGTTAGGQIWAIGEIPGNTAAQTDVSKKMMVIANGNPAVCYTGSSRGKLTFQRALDSNGTTWGTPISISDSATTSSWMNCEIIAGNPAFTWEDDSTLKYARALNADGTSWGPIYNVSVAPGFWPFDKHVLADIGGFPMVCNRRQCVRAHDVAGASWPVNGTVYTGSVFEAGGTSLAYVNGRAAVVYVRDGTVSYTVAADLEATSFGPNVTITTSSFIGDTDLQIVNGYPAVAVGLQGNIGMDLFFIRALDASGSSWGTPVPAFEINTNVGSQHICLAVIDGYAWGFFFYLFF